MGEIKLTKNELRGQQIRLNQLNRYLPTLQLKKALLQAEVFEARLEIAACEKAYAHSHEEVELFSQLLTAEEGIDFAQAIKVEQVVKRRENIAGVDVPYFERIDFAPFNYGLFETAAWVDASILSLKKLVEAKARITVAEEKKKALEDELRQVSIRVNLFEKILIPRAKRNIKRIKVFLGDQQLAAVSQAKVAKTKIEERSRVILR